MIYAVVDLMSGAVFALLLEWLFEVYCGNRGFKRFLLTGLFTLYLCEMFNVVGIPAVQYIRWEPTVNLIPFGDEKNLRYFFQVSMNAVMFLPFGFLLPLLWKTCRSWKVTTLAGFLTSALIETIQLFCFRSTDVDDLMMNTLGASLGYALSWLCFRNRWKRPEEAKPGRINDLLSLTVSILIPLLVTMLLRSFVSEWIYGLLPLS